MRFQENKFVFNVVLKVQWGFLFFCGAKDLSCLRVKECDGRVACVNSESSRSLFVRAGGCDGEGACVDCERSKIFVVRW